MIDRVVQAMLDRFEAGWRPPLDESIPEWEETLRPILEETWAAGYSDGIADCEKRLGI